MTCRSLMVEPPAKLAPTDTVADAVTTLLASGLPALPVVDHADVLQGLFGYSQVLAMLLPAAARLGDDLGDLAYVHESIVDLQARLARHGDELVRDRMDEADAVTPNCQGMEALLLLSRGKALLAVVDDHGKLMGIITKGAALAAIKGSK